MAGSTNGQSQVPQLGSYYGPQSAEPTLIPHAKKPYNAADHPMQPPHKRRKPEGPITATPVGREKLPQKLFSIREIAEYGGLDYKTVFNLIRTGQIRAYRIGILWKTTVEDFQDYLERNSNIKEAKASQHSQPSELESRVSELSEEVKGLARKVEGLQEQIDSYSTGGRRRTRK